MHTASPGDLHPSHEHPTCSSQEHRGEVCCALFGQRTFITSTKILNTSFSSFFFFSPQDPELHRAAFALCSWAEKELRAQEIRARDGVCSQAALTQHLMEKCLGAARGGKSPHFHRAAVKHPSSQPHPPHFLPATGFGDLIAGFQP